MTNKNISIGLDKPYSLIIQATEGCSYNKCTYCTEHKKEKFRVRNLKEIVEDLKIGRQNYKNINKIFITDGDALSIESNKLIKILGTIYTLFPEVEEVNIYGTAKSILEKTLAELKQIEKAGLTMVYMGVESGNNRVLYNIEKGIRDEELVLAGNKVKHSNIKLNITVLLGVGGQGFSVAHAIDTASVINRINPNHVNLEDLKLMEDSEIYRDIKEGRMKLLTPSEILEELRMIVERLNIVDSSVSYSGLSRLDGFNGRLPRDKDRLLKEIDKEIEDLNIFDENSKRI